MRKLSLAHGHIAFTGFEITSNLRRVFPMTNEQWLILADTDANDSCESHYYALASKSGA